MTWAWAGGGGTVGKTGVCERVAVGTAEVGVRCAAAGGGAGEAKAVAKEEAVGTAVRREAMRWQEEAMMAWRPWKKRERRWRVA